MAERNEIRVLLADDHAVLRAGLRALLNAEPDIQVVAEAGNGQEAIEKTAALQPDVVVLDLTMPDMNGLEATAQIARRHWDSKVLILTMHAEAHYIVRVLQAGAMGYVLKSAADTDLIAAIRQVHAGKAYLYPEASQILVAHYQKSRGKGEEGLEKSPQSLSERERQVLILTAQGYSSREIGAQLHISPKTVDTYRQRLMEKLDLHHRADLVQYALRYDLLKRTEEP